MNREEEQEFSMLPGTMRYLKKKDVLKR